MEDHIVLRKSHAFALRIVQLRVYLHKKHSFLLKDQVFRSGISIGAIAEEFGRLDATKDSLEIITSSYREALGTHFWLRLLRDTGYIDDRMAHSLLADCEELLKIIGSIQKTVKGKTRH